MLHKYNVDPTLELRVKQQCRFAIYNKFAPTIVLNSSSQMMDLPDLEIRSWTWTWTQGKQRAKQALMESVGSTVIGALKEEIRASIHFKIDQEEFSQSQFQLFVYKQLFLLWSRLYRGEIGHLEWMRCGLLPKWSYENTSTLPMLLETVQRRLRELREWGIEEVVITAPNFCYDSFTKSLKHLAESQPQVHVPKLVMPRRKLEIFEKKQEEESVFRFWESSELTFFFSNATEMVKQMNFKHLKKSAVIAPQASIPTSKQPPTTVAIKRISRQTIDEESSEPDLLFSDTTETVKRIKRINSTHSRKSAIIAPQASYPTSKQQPITGAKKRISRQMIDKESSTERATSLTGFITSARAQKQTINDYFGELVDDLRRSNERKNAAFTLTRKS